MYEIKLFPTISITQCSTTDCPADECSGRQWRRQICARYLPDMAQRPSYATISHRESFSHERLKLAENSIRLFQVQGGSKNEPLSLRITQYASHRRPPYRAISYTWGSSANVCKIVVNGRTFQIHYNLWSLLFHLRERKETAFLWADALCIDQANLRERNFHVQLMGKIYDQAKSVIVWLGLPSTDRMEIRAMNLIQEFNATRKTRDGKEHVTTYLATETQPRWETLLRMCQHTYWTRTWIVQEFLRAPAVEVICGTASINWDEFENLLLVVQNAPYNHKELIVQILQSRPARLTLRRRARAASTLHELLGEYHDSMCTERSDKVYGILGLASDCGEDEETGQVRGMVPDYNKHIVEVYLDAVACIERSLNSHILLPSVANLVRQTLLLTENEFADYVRRGRPALVNQPILSIIPQYVGVVNNIIPSWTSIQDLKSKLTAVDWGQYVGYEMRSQPGLGRRASARVVHSSLPDDMFQNMTNVAETDPEILYLHNYPPCTGLVTPLDHVALHTEDKRLYNNPNLSKPCIIIEQNSPACILRLGFACTDTRRGDLILQFRGLDTTLICRQIGADIVLVGKAMMIKHSEIKQEHKLDSVCAESPWLCPCPCSYNEEEVRLETNGLSLAELLTRS